MIREDIQKVRDLLTQNLAEGQELLHSMVPGGRGHRFIFSRTLPCEPMEDELELGFSISDCLIVHGYRLLEFQPGKSLTLLEVSRAEEGVRDFLRIQPLKDETSLLNTLFAEAV